MLTSRKVTVESIEPRANAESGCSSRHGAGRVPLLCVERTSPLTVLIFLYEKPAPVWKTNTALQAVFVFQRVRGCRFGGLRVRPVFDFGCPKSVLAKTDFLRLLLLSLPLWILFIASPPLPFSPFPALKAAFLSLFGGVGELK